MLYVHLYILLTLHLLTHLLTFTLHVHMYVVRTLSVHVVCVSCHKIRLVAGIGAANGGLYAVRSAKSVCER